MQFSSGGTRVLAQAVTGTPGHVNAMARAVRHFLNKFPAASMRDGDVFFTNDPWKGTGHLHDFTFVTPTFRRGRMVGLFASTSHMVDVGGRGMGPDSRQGYEEGIYIPLMHFAREGKTEEALIEVIRQFQVFPQIMLMTNGGPNNTTRSIVQFTYEQAFMQLSLGYATAASQILLAIMLIGVSAQLWLERDKGGQR